MGGFEVGKAAVLLVDMCMCVRATCGGDGGVWYCGVLGWVGLNIVEVNA